MKNELFIFSLFFFGMVYAANCTSDSLINLKTESTITCSGMPATGLCYAVFSSNTSQVIMYPKEGSAYDGIFLYKSDVGGNVAIPFITDDRFDYGSRYNVTVYCASTASYGSGNVVFNVAVYRSPVNEFTGFVFWLRDNPMIVFLGLMVICFAIFLFWVSRDYLFN